MNTYRSDMVAALQQVQEVMDRGFICSVGNDARDTVAGAPLAGMLKDGTKLNVNGMRRAKLEDVSAASLRGAVAVVAVNSRLLDNHLAEAIQRAYLRFSDPDEREFDHVFAWSDPVRSDIKEGRYVSNGTWRVPRTFVPSASASDVRAIVASAIREQSGEPVTANVWVRLLPCDDKHTHPRVRIRTSDGRLAEGCSVPLCGGLCGEAALMLGEERAMAVQDCLMMHPLVNEWTGKRV